MSTNRKRTKTLRIAVRGLGHLTGILVLTALFGLFFMSETAAQALIVGLGDSQLGTQIMIEAGLIFGVISLMWALGYILFRLFREHRKSRKRRIVKLARGTIMTETLIVLPVFLLLVFGLCQMGVNSMAGLLTTLGTYEAARTVAVWAPEVGHDRAGSGETVSWDHVRERAEVAGAGVVTPVAASTATAQAQCQLPNDHPAKHTLRGMIGVGVLPVGLGETTVWSLAEAFSARPFAQRAPVKYQIAVCSSTVEFDEGSVILDTQSNARNEVSVTYTYVHANVFPLVRHIFANGADGYKNPYGGKDTTAIQRTYNLTQQITPNPEEPHQNVIESVLGGIGSWRD